MLDHCAEGQEINCTLCEEVHVVVDGDKVDLEVEDFRPWTTNQLIQLLVN